MEVNWSCHCRLSLHGPMAGTRTGRGEINCCGSTTLHEKFPRWQQHPLIRWRILLEQRCEMHFCAGNSWLRWFLQDEQLQTCCEELDVEPLSWEAVLHAHRADAKVPQLRRNQEVRLSQVASRTGCPTTKIGSAVGTCNNPVHTVFNFIFAAGDDIVTIGGTEGAYEFRNFQGYARRVCRGEDEDGGRGKRRVCKEEVERRSRRRNNQVSKWSW